jgi:myo-inositol-1(or 4)-monophosphatase
MPLPVDAALAAARAATAAAAELLAGVRATDVRGKGNPRDLITEWDPRSERVIRQVLHRRAPGVPVVGEEEGSDGEVGPDGQRWLVDPIDGTVNFAHGLPLWSIVVALEDPDGIAVGVVDAPALGFCAWARRGGGAWVSTRGGPAEPLAVSAVAELGRALLVTGFPADRASNPDNNLAAWAHLQTRAGDCRRLGSAALDLVMVARGWFDGYWERRLHPWDVAAGALIVAEAGGRVTSTTGGRFDPWTGDVLASNGGIHEALRAALAEVPSSGASSP